MATLMALILPAIAHAREAARRFHCRHNLRQLGLAIQNYAELYDSLPPSLCLNPKSRNVRLGQWSIHARLMPFIDQSNAFGQIRMEYDWNDPINQQTGVPQLRIPSLACPTDYYGTLVHYAGPSEGYIQPTNYAFNFGTWLVYDPLRGQGGDGCFHPNARIRVTDVLDGTSNTLCAAEVKSYQSTIINTHHAGAIPPTDPLVPATFVKSADLLLGPNRDDNEGHTEWCEGPVHQAGFTTVYTPNQCVPLHYAQRKYDIDWSTAHEGLDPCKVTYAAITSRSHHNGLVQVLMMDGSVRSLANSVALHVWRALGTRAGSESP